MISTIAKVFDLKLVFKIALLLSFLAALTAFSIWFVSFMSDIYHLVNNSSATILNSSIPPVLSCLIKILGIDTFINSAFSIFWTAAQFWIVAVGYILAYKSSIRAYDGIFKVFT